MKQVNEILSSSIANHLNPLLALPFPYSGAAVAGEVLATVAVRQQRARHFPALHAAYSRRYTAGSKVVPFLSLAACHFCWPLLSFRELWNRKAGACLIVRKRENVFVLPQSTQVLGRRPTKKLVRTPAHAHLT